MQVTRHASGSAADKARGIVASFPHVWHGAAIIDVGCRSRDLERALEGVAFAHYIGVDIDPDAEVVADVADRLPFDDGAADVVTAFDVLEHTDDIHRAFAELCRVAGRHVLITLPNCYELGIRIRIARGRPISQKYGLPLERVVDRHRWFFSLSDGRAFVRAQARANGWRVENELAVVGPLRARLTPAVRRWPDLLSPTYVAALCPAG